MRTLVVDFFLHSAYSGVFDSSVATIHCRGCISHYCVRSSAGELSTVKDRVRYDDPSKPKHNKSRNWFHRRTTWNAAHAALAAKPTASSLL